MFAGLVCAHERSRKRSGQRNPPFQNPRLATVDQMDVLVFPTLSSPLPFSLFSLFNLPLPLPFSHLLKRQKKIQHAIEDLYGQAEFSPDVISRTSKTLRQSDMPAFSIVDNLVEEEV